MHRVRVAAALFTVVSLLIGCQWQGRDAPPELDELAPATLNDRLHGDVQAVLKYRDGLAEVIRFMDSYPSLFPRQKLEDARVLSETQLATLRATYISFLDYQLALQSIDRYHRTFYQLDGAEREDSFLIMHSAFVARYRYALEFIERIDRDPSLEIVLNEPVPELGLPKNSYDSLRFRFLNVVRAAGFAALSTVHQSTGGDRQYELRRTIIQDRQDIWDAAQWSGPTLTLENAVDIVRSNSFAAWMPVQAGVAEWMGDTKVARLGQPLIQAHQIELARRSMVPGDFMLQRREWYLSNIGLPGFWSHAALYIGTPEERTAFFKNDPAVARWLQGQGHNDFDSLWRARFPESHASSEVHYEGQRPVVLEAMSEGVVFTSLEHSAAADSLSVLRPAQLSKLDIAQALLRAVRYAGRPYDFDFNFQTDSRIVCTELVYRAYEPGAHTRGIRIELVRMLGRPTLPANQYARLFDEEFGTEQRQLDLVLFLDGNEDAGTAVAGDAAGFRTSWLRPKWHVFTDQAYRRSGSNTIASDFPGAVVRPPLPDLPESHAVAQAFGPAGPKMRLLQHYTGRRTLAPGQTP